MRASVSRKSSKSRKWSSARPRSESAVGSRSSRSCHIRYLIFYRTGLCCCVVSVPGCAVVSCRAGPGCVVPCRAVLSCRAGAVSCRAVVSCCCVVPYRAALSCRAGLCRARHMSYFYESVFVIIMNVWCSFAMCATKAIV